MRDKLPLRNRVKTSLVDAFSSLFHPFWTHNILRKVGEVIRTLGGQLRGWCSAVWLKFPVLSGFIKNFFD